MVSLKGKNECLSLQQYRIGNKYAEALSNGLKLCIVNKINLASNRLNPQGGLKVLQSLNFNVRELDLSNNKIGESSECMIQLNAIIKNRRY